jgi:drug/metabolite transporter (DMT)-like permease
MLSGRPVATSFFCTYICGALNTTSRIHLSLLTVSLIYGATFSMAKMVMPSLIQPFAFILLRVGGGLLLFLAFHALFIREKVHKEDLVPLAVSAFFGVAANMLLFFRGLSVTTPVNASVLMLVTPVFVVLLAAVSNKERPSGKMLAGIFLAAAGALLLMGGWRLRFSPETVAGDIYIILNALSYAIYLVYVKKLMVKYHPVTVSRWNFIFGFLVVLPFGWSGLHEVAWAELGTSGWGILLFVVLGTTFLTYLLNAWALRHASSALVGSYIYLQPVFASFLAIIFEQDELSVQKVLFILLIFAGVYLAGNHQRKADNGN